MIENTIDPATGMATVRATMPNEDETLWPGTLVTAEMTLRTEDAVVVPSNAVEVSQTGSIVFVIDKGVAKVQRITTERQVEEETVVTFGLKGGETVVVDGQIRLRNGTHVDPRLPKRCRRPSPEADLDEHLGNLHPPPGPHDAVDGVVDRFRCFRLSSATGGRLAGGRFPDQQYEPNQ